MKKRRSGLLAVLLMLYLCCGEKSGFKKDGELYHFATALAAKWPVMDPVENRTLATCRYFSVRVDSFLMESYIASGRRLFDWARSDSAVLERTVRDRLYNLLERKLLLRAARTAGIDLAPSELDTAMNRLSRQNGGKRSFQQRLAADGLNMAQFKEHLRKEKICERLLQSIADQPTTVQEQEILEMYQQDKTVTFRHILVTGKGEFDPRRLQKLEELKLKINAFVDFAKLARQYSDDLLMRRSGGLYENVPRGYLPPMLDQLVFTAPIGIVQHSAAAEGDHFVLVIRRDKETLPLDQVRSILERQMLLQKKAQRVEQFKRRLIEEAQIHITI